MQHPALPSATTEVPAHEPTLLGLESEGWVYVGLTIFLLLAIFVAKAPQKIAALLDQRIADTRRSLDEAAALRQEAEALLSDARAKQTRATTDAEAIVAHAQHEAQVMIAKAEADLADLITRRTRMAEDKIEAEQRAAVAEVRAHAADAAVAAATRLIRERQDAGADRPLVDRTIGAIGAR